MILDTHQTISAGSLYIDEVKDDQHHAHEDHVITFLEKGFVTLNLEHPIHIKPGMLTLVPAGMPHALMHGKDMHVHWLSFSAANLPLSVSEPLMQPFSRIQQGAIPVVKLSPKRIPFVLTLLKELQNALNSRQPERILTSFVFLILNEVNLANNLTPTELAPETKLAKALQFIQLHCCLGISLKDVADAIHMHPAYLATKMKRATGSTVGEWITRYRLKSAQSLLANTDETVEQICIKVGWQDVTHFIRQFKKAYQKTPAVWRKQQNNKR